MFIDVVRLGVRCGVSWFFGVVRRFGSGNYENKGSDDQDLMNCSIS